ncbi:cap-specific mRNA (nucleoside-2'-O-)-methyltransferase 1, partial [Asbolus verrucosus]
MFLDTKVLRMMKMMGYKSGLGLGKNQQGITLPVEIKSQIGKRGLGLDIDNLEGTSNEWDFSLENIFEELDIKDLCQARTRANPFETIRSVFFMNRAALKMANIDAATDFMFTNIDHNLYHKDSSGPYYFADVCAGPGGFTEYILWRKKWLFKGFGFTLRDQNDFKITDSLCVSPVTFIPLYGVKGDGNVCCPANICDFKEKVLHETENKGVHFMMSDGKLAAFCRNPLLTDQRQEELRKECLLYWQIPDKPKIPLSKFTVEDLLSTTIDRRELLLVCPRELKNIYDLNDFVLDVKEWHYVPMQCKRNTNICNFYAGVGLSKVFRLQCNKWVKVKNLQLTRGTLLYGELVKEDFIAKNTCILNIELQQHKYSLHVIDALRLGDVSLVDLKFEERIHLIGIFCKAVNHEFRANAIRIRPKTINTLESLCTDFNLRKNELFGNYIAPLPVLGYKVNEESYETNHFIQHTF